MQKLRKPCGSLPKIEEHGYARLLVFVAMLALAACTAAPPPQSPPQTQSTPSQQSYVVPPPSLLTDTAPTQTQEEPAQRQLTPEEEEAAAIARAEATLAILPFTGGQGEDGETIAELFSFQKELTAAFTPVPRTSINIAIRNEQGFQ
ncbi:MAG: hypothetical protein LBB43_07950, partial [Spirochaetaceae bacterium]|nr:hypothetical protein [Spirochaetaceae bacterium]